jgi:hypothetical protein
MARLRAEMPGVTIYAGDATASLSRKHAKQIEKMMQAHMSQEPDEDDVTWDKPSLNAKSKKKWGADVSRQSHWHP